MNNNFLIIDNVCILIFSSLKTRIPVGICTYFLSLYSLMTTACWFRRLTYPLFDTPYDNEINFDLFLVILETEVKPHSMIYKILKINNMLV